MNRAVLSKGAGDQSVRGGQGIGRLSPEDTPGQLNNRIQAKKTENAKNVTREYQFLRITWIAANKSIRGMPGRRVPKKDVVHCEKLW